MTSPHHFFQSQESLDVAPLMKYWSVIGTYFIRLTQLAEHAAKLAPINDTTKSIYERKFNQEILRNLEKLKLQFEKVTIPSNELRLEEAEKLKHALDVLLKELNQIQHSINAATKELEKVSKSAMSADPMMDDISAMPESSKRKKAEAKNAFPDFAKCIFPIPVEMFWKENTTGDFNTVCETSRFQPHTGKHQQKSLEEKIRLGKKQLMRDMLGSDIYINGAPIPEAVRSSLRSGHNTKDKKESLLDELLDQPLKSPFEEFLDQQLSEDAQKQLFLTHSQSLMCYQQFFIDSALKERGDIILTPSYTVHYDCDKHTNNLLRVRSVAREFQYRAGDDIEKQKPLFNHPSRLATELQYTNKGDFTLKLMTDDLDMASLLLMNAKGHHHTLQQTADKKADKTKPGL